MTKRLIAERVATETAVDCAVVENCQLGKHAVSGEPARRTAPLKHTLWLGPSHPYHEKLNRRNVNRCGGEFNARRGADALIPKNIYGAEVRSTSRGGTLRASARSVANSLSMRRTMPFAMARGRASWHCPSRWASLSLRRIRLIRLRDRRIRPIGRNGALFVKRLEHALIIE